jgi:hypothetical protein
MSSIRRLKFRTLPERKPMATLNRTKEKPWPLKTPPGTSEYTMHVEEKDGVRVLVCTVGKTVLFYDARCIDDLHAMLNAAGGWVELGGADEQNQRRRARSRHGVALRAIQWVAGTA